MKKILLLLLATFLISAVSISQNRMTSAEYMAQHPELFGQPGRDNSSLQQMVVGDVEKELLNGVTYTYVGFFNGLGGPEWTTNPPCYTGQEAAALLFGGVPGDYAISIDPNSTDPSTITFTAWMVTWGIAGWAVFPQDFKVDIGNPGYNDPGGIGTATSAYCRDNNPPPGSSINYVWLVSGDGITEVPISDWALFIGLGLIVLFAVIRFRRIL